MKLEKIMNDLEKKHPGELEYLQAVREVLESLEDVVAQNPQFEAAGIIERIVEPDRVLSFKVPWVDDNGKVHVNLGYRIQFNNAIGPYKGGLRFHPSVNLSILKFLGFEQIFKNSLTTLPMGGGKGGSDFDPKGKSDAEIMRFCQAFMLELWKIIGPETDVPAGDIGVGGKEIGFMFGMYKKLTREHVGVLTGKGLNWGGSLVRPEATGFGAVYFAQEMLATKGTDFKGKTVAISGFGNVAWGAVTKVTELGGKVVTISGPDGYIFDPEGISGEKIQYMLELRASNQDIVKPYSYEFPGAQFVAGKRPWEVKCDVALPCATQNELGKDDAETLVGMVVSVLLKAPICLPLLMLLRYLNIIKFYLDLEKLLMLAVLQQADLK
jgi:glutamate dehydrogenase (NADP+)